MVVPPAGWYHGDGDPEGSVRYWDGAQWQGDPIAANLSLTGPATVTPQSPDAFYGVLAEPSQRGPEQVAASFTKLAPERAPRERKRHGYFPIPLKVLTILMALILSLIHI